MTTVTIVLSVLLFVSVAANVFLLVATAKAGSQLRSYDSFYVSSVEEIDLVVSHLSRLLDRDLLSNDPDVRNLNRMVVAARDILAEYSYGAKNKEKIKG